MRKRLNLCKTIVGIVKNSVGVVGRVKLFLLALFFLFHTTTFAYFPICCGCFIAFLVVTYPAILFFAFFGVHSRLAHTLCFIFSLLFGGRVPRHFIFRFFRGTRLLVHHLLWFQHTPICPKRTPLFHFLYFSGYAPPHTSLIVVSAHSYSPKTYPNILFLTFLWVRYSIA